MRARWVALAGFAFAALLLLAVAVVEPFTSSPATEAPGDVALDCEATLTGGRHPDIPAVGLEPLAECRPEAASTLERIGHDGPFPYPQDDGTFFNREGYLPPAATGAYRLYTVDTPGLDHRGLRRFVTFGGEDRDPSGFDIAYYSDDHYDTFWRVTEE